MSRRRLFLAASTSILLAASARALPQQFLQIPDDTSGSVSTLALPLRTGSFEKAVAGDFDADGFADLVMQRGTGLEMLYGPAHFDIHLDVATGVNDMAVLPPAVLGAAASLVTVGASGLVQHVWDPELVTYWQAITLEEGVWLGAKNVAVGVAPDGSAELIGLLATGAIVRRALGGATTTVVVVQGVQELQAVQFDFDVETEIAFVSGGVLNVYSRDGASLESAGSNYPHHALAPVRQELAGPEQLLWFITGQGGVNEILVSLGSGGPAIQDNFECLPGIVGCARGDEDGDGDDDLLISYKQSQKLAVFRNSGSGAPDFDMNFAGSIRALPYGTGAASTNEADPVWVDHDNDHDLDVLFPVQSSSTVFINAKAEPGVVGPQLDAGVLARVYGTGGQLHLLADVTAPRLAGVERLEIILWRKPGPGPLAPTEPDFYPPVWFFPEPGETGDLRFKIAVPLPEYGTEPFDAIYFFAARCVSIGGAAAEPRFPTRWYGLQVKADQAHIEYLEDVAIAGTIQNLLFEIGVIGQLGTIAEVVRLPDLPPDRPPRPRP